MLTHFTLTQPLSLDNALSSYQIIHKLITQMNKVIDEVNSIDSKAFEYTDREIIKLHNTINTQLSELEELLQSQIDVNKLDITDLKNRADNIEDELITINNKLIELREYIDDELLAVRNELNTIYHSLIAQMEALKQYVEELIKKMTVKVYSNYDGCKKDIKEALNDLYNFNKRRYLGSEVSFKFIKDILNLVQFNNSTSGSNYMFVKNVLTFSELKTLANRNTLINGKVPITVNANPTSDSDYQVINYYNDNKFKYFKYDFMIYFYLYIFNASLDYNHIGTSETISQNIITNSIVGGFRTTLGSFNFKPIPWLWFGWNVNNYY